MTEDSQTHWDSVLEGLVGQVREALADSTPIRIQGGNSKAFFGRRTSDDNSIVVDPTPYRGVVNYDPTELVITARAGTRLTELEAVLAEQGQMLAFEPPHFGERATLGGAIACGLSGPRRPYTGSARDFVLGVKLINGRAEVLGFGGQVMKNVAGYDVSRLVTGSLGTLGIILEVSLKVLPLPATERTLAHPCSGADAITKFNEWAAKPYPISAAAHDGEVLYLRLSGADSAVNSAAGKIGGEVVADGDRFWRLLREHEHPFFQHESPLWRLSVPPASTALDVTGRTFLDWGGAQRWLLSDQPVTEVFASVAAVDGHATLFRGGNRGGAVFQPLDPVLMKLHQRLKKSVDAMGIFNPGRLYAEF